MTFKTPFRLIALIAAIFAFAGIAAAQGAVTNSATTTGSLAATATVQTALNLVITANGSGIAVTGTDATFAMDFGNINGLGIGTPTTNVTATALGSNAGYLYTTPITLTPSFSGFTATTASIKVEQDASDSASAKAAAREGSSAAISAGTLLLTGGAAVDFTAVAANGTPITRYVGVVAPNSNGGTAIAGVRSINLVYTITATP